METIDIKVDMCDPLPMDYYREFHLPDESVLGDILSQTKSAVMYKIIRKNDEKPLWILMDIINFDEMKDIITNPPEIPKACTAVPSISNDIAHLTLCIKNGMFVKKHVLKSPNNCYLFSTLSNIVLSRLQKKEKRL